jgi:hypothetical protein
MAGTTGVGLAGNASSFNISSVIANPGTGGGIGSTGAGGTGGSAGTWAGGNGATGATTGSGGGGGGAGTTSNGGNAGTPNVYTAGAGGVTNPGTPGAGIGGTGVTNNSNGAAGATYGGGGSGGRRGSSSGSQTGGKGADGFVRLTFTVSLPSCVTPVAQPTSLILTPAATSIAGSFTASASANSYLVIRTNTSTAPSNPVNGTTYTAGTTALGGTIESVGASTTFNSTGLTTGTQFWYWVFAYNATTCSGGPLYLTTSALTGNAVTLLPACVTPGRPGSLTLTPSTTSIAGTLGTTTGNGYLVIMTTTATAPSVPVNGTTYILGSSALGGTIVSTGSSNTFNASGLTSSTQYWFWSYGVNEISCSGGPVYSTSSRDATTTTLFSLAPCTTPLAQPTALVLTPGATTMAGSFTASATANSYLVIRTLTATAPANPANGTTYTVGASALGGIVESIGVAITFNSTGLTANTQYWYWVFGYNATSCSGGPLYLTPAPLTNTATTLPPACTTPGRPGSTTLTPSSTSIAGTLGTTTGNAYLVIMTTTATAPSVPVNGTTYVLGTSALGGVIVGTGASNTFNATSLTPSTQYWFWSYGVNEISCSGGPVYSTSSRNGSATTLAGTVPCVTPTDQPTALLLTPFATSISGSFTAATTANTYLVIRTISAAAPSNPVDGTTYIAGVTALGGVIVSANNTTFYNDILLTPSTQYWYWVFGYNTGSCTGGPLYNTVLPLNGTETTLSCGGITNVATITTPGTATYNWSSLSWSLGHLPTSCENVLLELNISGGTTTDAVTVNFDVDFSVLNFTLRNLSNSTTRRRVFGTGGTRNIIINGDLIINTPGGNKFDRTAFGNVGTTTITGNVILGNAIPGATDGHASIGSTTTTPGQTFNIYGDMIFNPRGFTIDERAVFVFNKAGTQYIYNNTLVTDTTQPVLFETLKIGTTNATTLIFAGSAKDAYIEAERAAGVTIGVNSTLDLPADYSLNKLTIYTNFAEPFILLAGAKLRLGGNRSIDRDGNITGVTGSNFPASFSPYTFHATSTVEYYGDNTITQTIYNTPVYANLIANNAGGSGIGRAQKITTGALTVNTSFNINALTDVTLGTLGSNTSTVNSAGPLNIITSGGLYCNANVVSGAGAFTMSSGSYLGMGHAMGITPSGTAVGNLQMTGGRTYSTLGNYIYNGIVNQITGAALPASAVNDLTIDNPTTVTIANNQLVNGIHLLKQGTFDIGTTQITINGTGTMNAVTGKMKADQGTVEMKGTANQNLSGNWFVNKTISNLINANTISTTVAAAPADTLLISTKLSYGAVNNSTITTNDNLTLLSSATGTANFWRYNQ